MTATAPPAPGSLGEAIEPSLLLGYLDAMRGWLAERREELSSLDGAAQAAARGRTPTAAPAAQAQLTSDIMLALALWQAVSRRYDALVTAWDSGRVGETERRQLASLIWGRLETAGGGQLDGMTVSLPEACRLCDALTGSLRERLGLDPNADAQAGRVTALRASMERLRDQLAQEPPRDPAAARAQVDQLAMRLEAMVAKAERGGDIGGIIGPLEIDAARLERDLIVGASVRRTNRALAGQAADRARALREREQRLTALVRDTVAAVTPAPKYAVPEVEALGPVPDADADPAAYLARLDQVDRAFDVVERAYTAAAKERDELAASLAACPPPDDACRGLAAECTRWLERRPTPMAVAKPLVQAYLAAAGAAS